VSERVNPCAVLIDLALGHFLSCILSGGRHAQRYRSHPFSLGPSDGVLSEHSHGNTRWNPPRLLVHLAERDKLGAIVRH
jgi:hypothetical protein